MAQKGWNKDLLSELSTAMRDASICGLGQAAPNPLLSVIKYFPEEVGLANGQGAPRPKPAAGIVT
jgi:formate dehydrogenase